MDASTINEAMKPGSDREYKPDDLGKFGLGLKTASLSQCRRLTVASRQSKAQRRIEARRLDVDWIVEEDKWKAFILSAPDRDDILVEPLDQRPGTVVLWESLDRILGYKIPWGEAARAGLLRLAEQLDVHLGMVFHRFLAGEAGKRKKLTIRVNGSRIEPWDPFARSERRTEELPLIEFDVRTDTGVGIAGLRRFVLPPKEGFSSEAEWNRAGAFGRWNSLQGFYIYRANRLIQVGGWNRMRTQDEHSKLARAAIDFFPDLDSAFEINWAKVKVILPTHLREDLKQPIEDLVRRAKAVYSHSGSGSGGDAGARGRTRGSRGSAGGGSARGSGGVSHRDTKKALESAATRAGVRPALRKIVSELRSDDPEVARALGW